MSVVSTLRIFSYCLQARQEVDSILDRKRGKSTVTEREKSQKFHLANLFARSDAMGVYACVLGKIDCCSSSPRSMANNMSEESKLLFLCFSGAKNLMHGMQK